MDFSEAFGLEFLDLSGVDEYERNRVLASLQLSRPNSKFPWFIGDEKTTVTDSKPTNQGNLETFPPTLVKNHGYVSPDTETTRRVPISIINPETGIAVPINSNLRLVTNSESLTTSTVVNDINGPASQPLNSQYFSPVGQYYSSPVVTTMSSIPVHIQPTTYGNYTVSNTSHHEIPVNTTIFPTYLPQSYPVKAPVYYGVPPSQPIFVSHQASVDTSSYYQNSAPQYVQNVSTDNTVVSNNGLTQVSQSVPSLAHENQWVANESSVLNNAQEQTMLTTVSNSVSSQNTVTRKQVSPLSADTPAFTPKSSHNISLASHNPPTLLEPQRTLPEPENIITTIINPESTPATNSQNVSRLDTTPKQTGVWGAGKSWASLFTPKEDALNPYINGVTKPKLTEAVNKESNNNKMACPIKHPKKSQFIDPDCYRMGEFLTNYTVDGRAISLQPRGLINQSNYCYINSILQALIACPPMYNLLSGLAENISSNAKRKPTPVIDGICKFVKEFNHLPANMRVSNRRSEGGKKDQKKDQGAVINTDIPFEPSWIYKMLNGIRTDLIEGRQEDAEEFLGCLLNNLNDEMLELIKLIRSDEPDEQPPTQSHAVSDEEENWQVMGSKNKGSILRKTTYERTPITDVFGGSLKSKIHRTGDHITENTQPFLTLQLNIEKVKTVREALEALTTKYQLEGVTSSKTNEEVEAWQQVMLDELPVVLVLHLKCFDYKLDGCTKIIKALEFPIDLKIDGKLLSLKTTNAKEKQYKLFAVVYHDGKEATKGHYITDAFHVGYSSWLRYDDASVKQVQEEQVLNPQGTRVPYLLFYRRSDTIRSR